MRYAKLGGSVKCWVHKVFGLSGLTLTRKQLGRVGSLPEYTEGLAKIPGVRQMF
jgi:hypothetical protein